jgi:hypothetical protein
MRKIPLALILALPVTLSACGSSGLSSRDRPDEMAVSRQPPLVIPPDFALAPPAAGTAASQQSGSSQQQTLDAMFGGPAPRSGGETSALDQAGRALAQAGIRSEAGDPETRVLDKGSVTTDIVAAPEGDGQFARSVAGSPSGGQ